VKKSIHEEQVLRDEASDQEMLDKINSFKKELEEFGHIRGGYGNDQFQRLLSSLDEFAWFINPKGAEIDKIDAAANVAFQKKS